MCLADCCWTMNAGTELVIFNETTSIVEQSVDFSAIGALINAGKPADVITVLSTCKPGS